MPKTFGCFKNNAYLCTKKFKFNVTPSQDSWLKMVKGYEEISSNRTTVQGHSF